MPSIKGTQTEKNVLAAFAAESQARNRYSFFAAVAKKEGYELVADIFTQTALQEREHACRLFKFLEGGSAEITASFAAGVIGTTQANLEAAADGELNEAEKIYPGYAATATEEGFSLIAEVLRGIASCEKQHEKQFRTLLANLTEDLMFHRDEKVVWHCRSCGYTVEDEDAPKICPVCAHGQGGFEVLRDSY